MERALYKFSVSSRQWFLSTYTGQIHKSMKEFTKSNHDLLLSKCLVIYLCCAFEHEFDNHLKNNFPVELLEHASMIQDLGGAIDKSKLNFGHKMMVSMIEKTEAERSQFYAMRIEFKRF